MPAEFKRARLLGLTGLFVAAVLAYCAIWTHAVHWQSPVDAGFSLDDQRLLVLALSPDGPAERAGLKPYDRLIAIDDDVVARELEVHDALREHRAGDRIQVTVLLAGLNTPRIFELVLRQPQPREMGSWVGVAGTELIRAYPFALLTLVGVVLFRRPDGVGAWLAAIVTTGMIAAVPLLPFLERIPPGLRGEAVAFKILFVGVGPAFLFYYLSVFPTPSPLDERVPWLKSAWIAVSAVVAGGFALWSWGTEATGLCRGPWPTVGSWIAVIGWAAAAGLGFVSLVQQGSEARSEEEWSGIRVLGAGLAAALLPLLVLPPASGLSGLPLADFSGWVLFPAALLLLALPLCLGYVATARQALDLPILLRRIVRYLLVERGAIAVVSSIAAVAALAVADRVFRAPGRGRWSFALAVLAGALVGALLVTAGLRLHRRMRMTIDRTLFPGTCCSRQVLEELAERLPDAPSRADLVRLLEEGLGAALNPSFLALYFKQGQDCLLLEAGRAPGDIELIPLEEPMLTEASGAREVGSLARVEQVGSDCLVPIRAGGSGLIGLMALGPRRDGEPYTREEERLLLSVAAQAARALPTKM